MPPSVTPDLWSGYWGDHLYYTLTNLDPTLLPGSTIYRWPEVLGAHSKGHDAAIAIVKGAMKIISQKKTITGSKLAEMIRTVSISCTCVCAYYIMSLCTENLTVYLRSISLVELAMCHLMRMETDRDTVVSKINK